MHRFETHFIPENVAPVGTKEIVVTRADASCQPVKVGRVLLGSLDSGLTEGALCYPVLLLSDGHVQEDKYPTSTEDFKRALAYANNHCAFTIIAGDLVESGGVKSQLANYAKIVSEYSPDKPVYAVAGNHENYDGQADGTNGHHLRTYTGHPLYYSFGVTSDGQQVVEKYPEDLDYTPTPIEYDDTVRDVYIMVGHWGSYRGDGTGWVAGEFVTVEELQWLYETLEANRNKRCFVVNHVLPHAHGVGDPGKLYSSSPGKPLLWDVNDGGVGQAFINLLCHYKNTLLIHGHTHTMLELQEIDPKANYAEVKLADGRSYKSLHVPSSAVPRGKVDGSLQTVTKESEGSVMDVYPACVIINGRDFVDNAEDGHWIAAATYKIETPIVTVEAGTFVDETGLIKT
jgi:predicted phosphodiesterase